ncbi:hypothetical protein OKW21_002707 [Catalinimonas alkaloidigena]|nr:hypothetical protein [Catalinimonas alkaloidigena]MDF9797444.1 hypothetical protein [Catalinimonas alkaloidigena]
MPDRKNGLSYFFQARLEGNGREKVMNSHIRQSDLLAEMQNKHALL